MRVTRESFVTQSADKRPLSGVRSEMLQQMTGLLVALITLQSTNQSLFFIIINEKISVAFSPKTARTRNTHKKDDMFGR